MDNEIAARRRTLWLAAGVVAAAAVLVLFVWRPGQDGSPKKQTDVPVASPRQTFGANLAMFVSDRQLPSLGEMSCVGARRPPDACVDPDLKPWLPATDRVEVLGECGASDGPDCKSSGLLAGTGLQLLVRPGGARVFVCMDLLADDPRPLLPNGSGLRLFRRELGDYVIYEVTTLSEAQTLELFEL